MSEENTKVVDKRRFTEDGFKVGPGTPVYNSSDPDKEAQILEVDLHVPPVEQFSPSSIPSKTPGMDFGAALSQVLKGQRVTRLEWENPEIWLMMYYWGQANPKTPAGKYLTIHQADGTMNPLYVIAADMGAEDWVVVV